MGVCYNVLMLDEWNWEADSNILIKNQILKSFEEEFEKIKYCPDRVGEGWGWVLYDFDKIWPLYGPHYDIIMKHCDAAFYWSDLAKLNVLRLTRVASVESKKLFE